MLQTLMLGGVHASPVSSFRRRGGLLPDDEQCVSFLTKHGKTKTALNLPGACQGCLMGQSTAMKDKIQNRWPQPPVPEDRVVETIDDIAAAYAETPMPVSLRFWSPPDGASIHGVLWYVGLQQLAVTRFPDLRPVIVLDCGDRADLAHAALRAGLAAICYRGSPAMLAKLRAIAAESGAQIETEHPAQID